MESTTVARSYAEGIYALAEKHGLHDEFMTAFTALDVVSGDRQVRVFMESPKIERGLKKQVLRKVLADRVHPLFLNFVLLVLDKRRQNLFGAIANEYRTLADEKAGRLHVRVTVARTPAPELEQEIRARLSQIFGKTVIPHVDVDQRILGGIVVRAGDTVIDGSLRRRLMAMRRQLIART